MASSYPDWVLGHPKPREEHRKLSGYEMEGWLCEVPVEEVQYWVDNRRTDIQVTRLKQQISRVPDDGELYDWLVNDPDLEIEALAKNILKNGLRVPVVISYDKELLDGNRRYLAHRWIVQNGKPHEREQFGKLKAWVLKPRFSSTRDKLRVVTEYNFLDDFRRPWRDYIKAKLLWSEYYDDKKGYTQDDLVDIYGGPKFGKGKIVEFIKTYDLIVIFVNSSHNPEEAETLAAENFIWFQQLQRSVRDLIRNDEQFQQAVFDNIRNGYVVKTDDLKWLKEIRNNKDTWALFKKGEVEAAHIVRESLKLDTRKDPDVQLAKINGLLEGLLSAEDIRIETASEETLAKFHELAEQVPGQVSDVNRRIAYLVKKLQTITSVELANLSEDAISGLESALNRVITQAQSTDE